MQATEYVTLREVADRYRVRSETVRLWITRGSSGRKLRADWVAGRWLTTWDAVEHFLAEITAARSRSLPERWKAEQEEARRRLG